MKSASIIKNIFTGNYGHNKSIIHNQSKNYILIATAHHEAGHAICSLINYLQVVNVSLVPSEIQLGNTLFHSLNEDTLHNKKLYNCFLNAQIATFYAGLVAEKLYYFEACGSTNFPLHLRIGSSDDLKQANKLINGHNIVPSGKERFLYKKKIQQDLAKLLTEHWADTKLLAHLLYKKKRVNFFDLKNLLTKKSIYKEFWKEHFKKIKLLYPKNNNTTEDEALKIIFGE